MRFWMELLRDVIAAIAGAGFGAWLGARLAFSLERAKSAEAHSDERERSARELLSVRAAAGNMAMFALARMHNDLVTFKRQCVDEADKTMAPWFFQNGIDLPITNSHRFNFEALGFLFESRDPEMPLKLAIQEDNYASLVQTLRRRNAMHQEEAIPALSSTSQKISDLSADALKKIVGDRIYFTLDNYASDVRVLLSSGIAGTQQAADELRELLREMHPGHTIIGFSVPADLQLKPSPIEVARQASAKDRDRD